MNTTHNGKPKWCSTTPFKTCLEFTPGTTTTDDQGMLYTIKFFLNFPTPFFAEFPSFSR